MSDTTRIITSPIIQILTEVGKSANREQFQKFVFDVRKTCGIFLELGVPIPSWDVALRHHYQEYLTSLQDKIFALDNLLAQNGLPHKRLFTLLSSYIRSLEGVLTFFAGEAAGAPVGELQKELDLAVKSSLKSVASGTLDDEYAQLFLDLRFKD